MKSDLLMEQRLELLESENLILAKAFEAQGQLITRLATRIEALEASDGVGRAGDAYAVPARYHGRFVEPRRRRIG